MQLEIEEEKKRESKGELKIASKSQASVGVGRRADNGRQRARGATDLIPSRNKGATAYLDNSMKKDAIRSWLTLPVILIDYFLPPLLK